MVMNSNRGLACTNTPRPRMCETLRSWTCVVHNDPALKAEVTAEDLGSPLGSEQHGSAFGVSH